MRRRIWANALRNASFQPLPAVAQEFLLRLLGSAICFWLAGKVAHLAGASPVSAFAVLGILYSGRAAYLKYRLARDPGFEIRGCGCGGRRHVDEARVLESRESAVLGIPSAAFGVLLYVLLLVLQHARRPEAELVVALIACGATAYLSSVMVFRIRSLCPNCINVAALNALILLQLWLGG